jgi:signal transduction histidine kinase
MKKALLFLLLFPVCVFAQQQAVFRIDSLPKEGILLNEGWKWHAGDNPEWSKAEFNDSKWEGIDPTKSIFELSQLSKEGEISWFRLRFSVSKNPSQQVAAMVRQTGASEIYLNGKILERYGVLAAPVEAFNPLNRPILLPIDSAGQYCLAIRYALQPGVRYNGIYNTRNQTFILRLADYKQALKLVSQFDIRYTNLESYKLGIFFILFVLHFSLYFFNRNQKAHLSVAFAFLAVGVAYLFKLIGDVQNLVAWKSLFFATSSFFNNLSPLLTLQTLFLFLGQKKGMFYWLLVLFTVGLGVSVFIFPLLSWGEISFILSFLVTFEHFRVVRNGIKANIRGAWILAVGVTLNALFYLVLFSFIGFFISVSPTLADVVFNLAVIAFPVALSIYLGIDSAYTNKELNQKLSEVEILSTEKQQILATQNETLEHLVVERTTELNQTIATLKSTQSQLIQSEKLASLGELTAGIAHEIQNPLNFVNNFSELSVELAEELKEEINKPELDKGLIEELAADLATNQEKINHHGKRASAIVKGMLEHSRAGDAMNRVSTDLNALADEYLRLAYHGLRAKDSSFNATMKTHFDPDLPKIEVIPQDIGRVLLNLINNAFYAIHDKAKQGIEGYSPTVTLRTRKLPDAIEITVKDNGNGIPDAIKDKIFQPFFTTKPTGQGTGLGLSLAYDIVTKGHGGSIDVESSETGTLFIIRFPA